MRETNPTQQGIARERVLAEVADLVMGHVAPGQLTQVL